MFSFIASLIIIIISSMFMTPTMMDTSPIESSTNVNMENPFTILDNDVELSYGEYTELARECYMVTTSDDDAEWCINLLAHEYPELGWTYYSKRSLNRGEVTPIENEFFTYYDLNIR